MFLITVYKHSIDIRGDTTRLFRLFVAICKKKLLTIFVCWHRRFRKPSYNVQITTTKSHNFRSTTKRSITLCETRYCHQIRDTLTVIELNCPYETNTTKSREYKETRYKEIKSKFLTPPSNFQLMFLEVTSLGFVTKNIKTSRHFFKSININERHLIGKLQEVAIRCSYLIYCQRNKNWNEPNLISYEWYVSNTNDD